MDRRDFATALIGNALAPIPPDLVKIKLAPGEKETVSMAISGSTVSGGGANVLAAINGTFSMPVNAVCTHVQF